MCSVSIFLWIFTFKARGLRLSLLYWLNILIPSFTPPFKATELLLQFLLELSKSLVKSPSFFSEYALLILIYKQDLILISPSGIIFPETPSGSPFHLYTPSTIRPENGIRWLCFSDTSRIYRGFSYIILRGTQLYSSNQVGGSMQGLTQ